MSKWGFDQDGDPIPDDLVPLPVPWEYLSDEDIMTILKADWYEPDERRWQQWPLLISWSVLDPMGLDASDDDATEALVACGYTSNEKLVKVHSHLNRFDPVDGWYHA